MALLPGSADARLLVRVVREIGRGARRSRAVATILDVEVRAIEGVLATARWLGILKDDPNLVLSESGVGLLLAGNRPRRHLRGVVRAHPTLGPLVASGRPDRSAIEILVRALVPTAPEQAQRASARLIARISTWGSPPDLEHPTPNQLPLALPLPGPGAPPRLELSAGIEESPDVYLHVLRALLDHGELTTPHLRAILDRAGGNACPLGGYISTALRRGDAFRVGDHLVVSPGALTRRAVAESALSVALSDPDFREVLLRDTPPPDRFRSWYRRFFRGQAVAPAIERLLLGRSLHELPQAGTPGELWDPPSRPILLVAQGARIAVATPSTLVALGQGVSPVNTALQALRRESGSVRLPTALDERVLIHGGLFAPGELRGRAIADGVSLRTRAVRCVPAMAFLVALGVVERRGGVRIHDRGKEVEVEVEERGRWGIEDVFAAFVARRGWAAAGGQKGAPWHLLVEAACRLGLLARAYARITIDDPFYSRCQTDPEYRELWEGLQPWCDTLTDRAVLGVGG